MNEFDFNIWHIKENVAKMKKTNMEKNYGYRS